jgi:hypothetical protein
MIIPAFWNLSQFLINDLPAEGLQVQGIHQIVGIAVSFGAAIEVHFVAEDNRGVMRKRTWVISKGVDLSPIHPKDLAIIEMPI